MNHYLEALKLFYLNSPKADGWQNGLTDNYVRVKIKYPRDLFNQILPVRLEAYRRSGCGGRIAWHGMTDTASRGAYWAYMVAV